MGLIFEVVAAEMGWQTRAEAATRVNLTLTALAGELPGFTLARQASDGWIPTFFNRSTGAKLGKSQPYTVLDSGLNVRTRTLHCVALRSTVVLLGWARITN